MVIAKANIGNALTSSASNHVVAVSSDIYDEDVEMYQSDINSSYRAELDDVNKRINSITDSLGKITLITENI